MYQKSNICDLLRGLVLIVQFKKREKQPWRKITFRLKPATLLKVILVHGGFYRFLNCTIKLN